MARAASDRVAHMGVGVVIGGALELFGVEVGSAHREQLVLLVHRRRPRTARHCVSTGSARHRSRHPNTHLAPLGLRSRLRSSVSWVSERAMKEGPRRRLPQCRTSHSPRPIAEHA
eukprot:910350-Rhodomonas_salina.3